QFPVIPLKNTVVFPHMVLPLSVGRPRSLAAAEAAAATEEKLVVVVTQRNASVEEPTASDLYTIGTLAVVKRSVRLNDTNVQFIVQGIGRVELLGVGLAAGNYLIGSVHTMEDLSESSAETEALHRAINDLVAKALSMMQNVPEELASIVISTEDPVKLAYLLA